MATPVIAIFDIGKTNKKALLFDQSYRVVYETSARLEETTDEDGDPCEDVDALTKFIYASLDELFDDSRWEVRAVNFSAYGASFVCVDAAGIPVCPLYNYLKPYPPELSRQFYDRYGGEQEFSAATASPVLGSLNSGMQLFRIRQRHPEVFKRIRYALHLPQYLSFLLSRKPVSDITSIGCHTNLWDFRQGTYHEWVSREGIMEKLAPPVWPSERFQAHYKGRTLIVGAGLHDSSAALIPYLKSFSQPFILLSTGTWNISLNPFNNAPLTAEELAQDCLCYLTYEGKAVK
ncbi:MAG TPA: FGGY family carbohydrate kinase, partial [Chryseosolibacter sp.]|nr:FGGY family carbohydrate kinase [Chryseosolibacter sp.]